MPNAKITLDTQLNFCIHNGLDPQPLGVLNIGTGLVTRRY